MRKFVRQASLVISVVVLTAIVGVSVGIAAAEAITSTTAIEHVVVRTTISGGSTAVLRSEFWIDADRHLARVVDEMPQGPSVTATGPDWILMLPALEGPGHIYRSAPGAPVTGAVTARLYFYRDTLASGQARVQARTEQAITLELPDRRVATIDAETGLVLMETDGRTRADYVYELRENLDRSNFPLSFFEYTADRTLAVRQETDTAGARAMALFDFESPGDTAAGRPLQLTLVQDAQSPMVTQQIHQRYGEDVEISWSLLVDPPGEGRPDGVETPTSRGIAFRYETVSSVQLMFIDGTVVLSIFAPDLATALSVVDGLR